LKKTNEEVKQPIFLSEFIDVDEEQLILVEEKESLSERILSEFIAVNKKHLSEISAHKLKILESKEHDEFEAYLGLALRASEHKNTAIQEIAFDLVAVITGYFEQN